MLEIIFSINYPHTKGSKNILNMDYGCEQLSLSHKVLVRNPCILKSI
jgi:hypothetical protein